MTCTRCHEPLDTAAKCAGVDTCAACAFEAGELEVTPMIPPMRLSRLVLGIMLGRDTKPAALPPKPPKPPATPKLPTLRPVAESELVSRWARQADAGRDEGEAA